MARLSAALRKAVASDCATDMDEVLKARKSTDFEQLRRLLSEPAPEKVEQRARVIYALGRWGDSRAVPDIRKAIPKLDEPGLLAAIDALGRLGTAQAVREVIKHAEHKSPDVRKFVIRALGRSSRSEATDALKEIEKSEPNAKLRKLAAAQSGRGRRRP